MQKLPKFAVTLLALACTLGQAWADEKAPMPFSELAAKCAPTVHPQTLKSLIGNESTYNPYAIGVVDGRLERQPQSLREAVATAERLEREGYRFSVGIGQLLVTNMRAMGLTYAEAFEPCRNLQTISDLMVKNYTKALTTSSTPQEALRKSFSMYYSGNDTRGFRPDKEGDLPYVQKVVVGALSPSSADPIVPAVEATEGDEAIPVAAASAGAKRAPVRVRTASQQQSGPWVIVTDENGQAPQPAQLAAVQVASPDQPKAPEQPRIQVALDTGDAVPVEQFQRFSEPKAAPAPASAQGQTQVEPSFVQIIN
ncbi:lytic transglycosylase domain-containing protein [Pseudomonas aeruginosa]|uniref:lytic transglycosylase domain-containing protein n=1 Tax=Pseudomonas koreensis TaxID=198620 RepID=UPI0018E69EC7|nr:lytic transglycosylase domain-containing protein [Pseudomonas koreensis]MBI6949140.1 lytic transglycosylase domain-containing protein [Pseudomonas koreensis]MDR9465636.1 lytic transglycosylase domain-containing protein [Pseudomonas aeruginosa]MDR9475706.1 lytic transglycosylase domain-containing protein [Pseudomonas aeruginosa]